MKFLKLKLKLNRTLLLTVLFFVAIFAASVGAQTFDKNLEVIARLHTAKKYADLLQKITGLKASEELADLRLFLEAEALKGLGRKAEAFEVYSKILKQFPETEVAFQSRFTHFVLQLDTADETSIPKLEGIARSLPSSWQRGTALEKLQDLPFLKAGRKGRIALAALREFQSENPFYRTAPASNELLKKILQNPELWAFGDDEWLEVLLIARSESLLGELFKRANIDARIMGKWGLPALELFKAEMYVQQKKLPLAMQIYSSILAGRKALPAIMALTYQFRGDANHFAEKHNEAVADYRAALQMPSFPVNEVAAQYRTMRSAYRLGKDAECLELLGRLVKAGNLGTLFPVHLYEMGLEYFDNGQPGRSVPFFMLLARNFPGHYRADDALGYAILAQADKKDEAQTLLKLLKKKYPNSFFIPWVSPESKEDKLFLASPLEKKLKASVKSRIAALKKLWKTDFATLARAEAIKLTDKYPGDLALYKAIIEIARQNQDYNQIVAYGERLARQTLEADQSLASLPKWAWEALYPLAYEHEVRVNAQKFGIDPFWILSIMREESHFKPDTLSRSNAMCLMQILPTTGKWIADKLGEKGFRKEKLWQPELNIRYGAWYLRYLSDMFKGDLYLASASYNGGQGNVLRKVEQGPYGHLPVFERLDRIPLPETRDYYKKVMGSHWNYIRLYK